MRDLATGLRLFARAAAILARAPRLYLLGIVPALLTLLVFVAAFALLLWRIDELATWLTPFADAWAAQLRQGVRVVAGVAVLVAAGLFAVVSYTACTLLVGGPFYERLSVLAERHAAPATAPDGAGQGTAPDTRPGGEPGPDGGWRGAWRGAADSAVLVLASLAWSVPLVVAGFLPLVGQTVVPLIAVGVGSWLLALELVAAPLQRRGMGLAERRRALRHRRALTLGAAVPGYLLCAIPFTAALAMPVAVVAGTLLAREVLDGPPGAPQRPGPAGVP